MASNEPLWHDGAIADAAEARNWHAERSPLAARGFLLELQAPVAAVTEAPERWPMHRHGGRRFVFPHKYPYSLAYRTGPPVQIVAIALDKWAAQAALVQQLVTATRMAAGRQHAPE